MRFRPYSVFLWLGIFVVVYGYEMVKYEASQVVNIRDTYFVASAQEFYSMVSILFLGLWTVYALTDRYIYRLHGPTIWIHSLLSFGSVLAYFYMTHNQSAPSAAQFAQFEEYQRYLFQIQLIVLVFLLGLLLFPINIFRSVILRARNRSLEE